MGLYWDNGKENGNYYSILGIPVKGFIGVLLGLYRDNGKEKGNYYNIGVIGLIGASWRWCFPGTVGLLFVFVR